MANELHSEASGHPHAGPPPDIPAGDAGSKDVSEDQIRERAYLIWVDEGKPDARDLDHWLRAKWALEQEQ
jgi:hypothetical protein